MVEVDQGAVERIRSKHPMQYGLLRDGTIVYETGNDNNPQIESRYNRCPTCEQWSPCDVRKLLEDVIKEHTRDHD